MLIPARFTFVKYWPSTEPSIKRWTGVYKRKNSETGASGRRYRNITLTCGCGWIRWWWQMRMPTWSRWMSDSYITRCHRRLGSISSSRSWSQLGTRCRRENQLGQYVAVCPRLQLTSHTQETSNLSRIKGERYIFMKKCLRSFIEVFFISAHVLCSCIYVCFCTAMYGPPHMAVQKQDDQHGHIFSNYVRISDVVQKTCLMWWTIGKSGERGSGISVLPARHDDDDDDMYAAI